MAMTADEMFKELGYEKSEEDDDILIYEHGDSDFGFVIGFDKREKTYAGILRILDERQPFPFNADEHRAVTEKLKELKWI